MAHARLKDRQMTCGSAECKREWHRRSCAQWNKEHIDYFKANYLHKKLQGAGGHRRSQKALQDPSLGGLLGKDVQEVIGVQQLIIIEYLGRLLIRRFQDVIRRQHIGIVSKLSQLPPI